MTALRADAAFASANVLKTSCSILLRNVKIAPGKEKPKLRIAKLLESQHRKPGTNVATLTRSIYCDLWHPVGVRS